MALQHETAQHSVEEIRVTSHDLAKALAAIESRRQAQAERDYDTIALGEAVRQLGLDITAEELLDEIRAQHDAEARARQAEQEASRASSLRRQRLRKRATTGIGVLGVLLLLFVGINAEERMRYAPSHVRYVSAIPRSLGYSLAIGPTCSVSLDTIEALNTGTKLRDIRPNNEPWSGKWELSSVNGKLYVKGWRDRIKNGHMQFFSSRPLAADFADSTNSYHPAEVPISRFKGIRDPETVDMNNAEEVTIRAE